MDYDENEILRSVYCNRLRRLGVNNNQIKNWARDCSLSELKSRIALAKEMSVSHLDKAKKFSRKQPSQSTNQPDLYGPSNEEDAIKAILKEQVVSKIDVDDIIAAGHTPVTFSFDANPVTKISRVNSADVVIDEYTDKRALNKHRLDD